MKRTPASARGLEPETEVYKHICKSVEGFRGRVEKDKVEGKLKWTSEGEKKV